MTFLSFMAFLPSVAVGVLVVHLLWSQKSPSTLPFKLSIGVGLGLGISSILYFIVLQIAPGRVNILILQISLVLALSIAVYYKHGMPDFGAMRIPALSRLQWGLFGIFSVSVVVSVVVFANYVISRPQGALDAWSIWNRAARFIHRDPENWAAAISPDLPPLRHADYPLLIPLNAAWGWDVLGNETLRVPMVQAGLFTFAAILLMFGALTLTRTVGQASLASLVLMAASGIVPSGTSLIADVPLAYFILASAALMYLFTQRNEYPLLTLSGFMAGLGGWTKNEGLIFILAGFFALVTAASTDRKRALKYYIAGLLIPMLVIVFFKSLAPPNDLALNSGGGLLEKIADPSRYRMILESLAPVMFQRESVFLVVYMLVMGTSLSGSRRKGIFVLGALLVLQLLGYAAVYLVTPYDLSWHLFTSQHRLIFHVIPLAIFLCFSVSGDPETVFAGRTAEGTQ